MTHTEISYVAWAVVDATLPDKPSDERFTLCQHLISTFMTDPKELHNACQRYCPELLI